MSSRVTSLDLSRPTCKHVVCVRLWQVCQRPPPFWVDTNPTEPTAPHLTAFPGYSHGASQEAWELVLPWERLSTNDW